MWRTLTMKVTSYRFDRVIAIVSMVICFTMAVLIADPDRTRVFLALGLANFLMSVAPSRREGRALREERSKLTSSSGHGVTGLH